MNCPTSEVRIFCFDRISSIFLIGSHKLLPIHFFACGCDISGRFDNSLAAVMVLVQLSAEILEHGEYR